MPKFVSEFVQVPIDMGEGFGPMPTKQELLDQFASIVSPEDWACRCGAKMGHPTEECLAVAKMLRLGTDWGTSRN